MFTQKSLLLRSTALMVTSAAALVAMGSSAFAADQVASGVAAAQPASTAQPAPQAGSAPANVLSEIVITGERREENVQKAPVAVSAFGVAQIQQAGVQNFEDIAKMSPSISIISLPGGTDFINIRGVGVGVSTPFQSAGVPMMVDGMYLPNSGYYVANSYFDLSNVELYRGPQGTFAGQNSTGGAIFINSKQPDFNGFSGYAQQLVGNYDWYQTQIGANVPINDQFSARIAINAETRGGWTKNVGPLNPLQSTGPQSGANNPGNLNNLDERMILRWKPSDSLDIRLRYDHNDDKTNGSPSLNEAAAPAGALYNTPNSVSNVPSPRTVAYFYEGRTEFTSDRLTANVAWNINNDIELKSVTGYQHYLSQSSNGSSYGTPFSTAYGSLGSASQGLAVLASKDDYFVQELDLLSTGSGPLQWVVGADGYTDTTPIHNDILSNTVQNNSALPNFGSVTPSGDGTNSITGVYGTGTATNCVVYGHGPGVTTGCPGLGELNYYQRAFSYAGFGEVKYNFTNQLQVIVGGRWTYYQINLLPTTNITDAAGNVVSWVPGPPAFLGIGYCGGGVAGASPVGPPAVAPALCQGVNGVASYSKPSGRAVLNWFPNPSTTVYGSVSYGFKQGSYVTQLDEGPGTHPGYLPETITDYELGLKTKIFDDHLKFSGNVFYEDYDNYQAAFFLSSAPIPLTKNINTSTIYGVEFQSDFVWDDFRASADVGYNHSQVTGNSNISLVPSGEYGTAADPSYIPASANPFACTVTPVGGSATHGTCENFIGRALNYAPSWTLHLTGQYNFHVWGGTVTPWVQYAYISSQWATLFNAPQDFVPAYGTLDFRIAYQSPNHWRTEAFVTNVLDTKFIAGVTGGTLGASPGVILGPPMQAGVRLKYTF